MFAIDVVNCAEDVGWSAGALSRSLQAVLQIGDQGKGVGDVAE